MMNGTRLAAMGLSLALTLGAGAASAAEWELLDWNGTQVWGAEWTSTTKLSFTAARTGDTWYRIYFDGYTEQYDNGNTPLPGLASTVLYRLTDITNNNKNWTFEYVVQNASHDPVEAARVSMIGFDVTPDVKSNGVTLGSGGLYKTIGGDHRDSAAGEFDLADDNGYEGRFDICLTTISGVSAQKDCDPGNDVGPSLGQSGSGSFTLKFQNSQSEIFFLNPVVAYDDVEYEISSGRSSYTKSGSYYDDKYGYGHYHDSKCGHVKEYDGFGTPDAYVPEPSTWAMMILGFGAAGSVVRRRRAAEAA